ncbi:hypothetical protein GC194_09555 [bacterium]|nr:hypothetical protein [bacterium]
MKTFCSSLAKTLWLFSLLLVSFVACAQDNAEKKKAEKKEIDPDELLARKSAIRSALLPGWGQATNGKWHSLKIPIIYAGLGTLGYMAHYNNSKYKCYKSGYIALSKGEPFSGCDGFTTIGPLKTGMDSFHKSRDLFIILTGGFYALNILDAYVWAHLGQFDNSDDLTMQLHPSFINIAGQQYTGMSLTFRF